MSKPTEVIQFSTTAKTKQRLEEEAARLRLSVGAYMLYLFERSRLSTREASELDRDVRQVFGRHGELMRRLAK